MGCDAVTLGFVALLFQRNTVLHAQDETGGAQRPTTVPTLQCSVLLSSMLKTLQMMNL